MPIRLFIAKTLNASIEVHFHELFLRECQPEFEIKRAPLWIVKDVQKSSAAFLLALHQVLFEGLIFLCVVLADALHEEAACVCGGDLLHGDLEDGLGGGLLLRAIK